MYSRNTQMKNTEEDVVDDRVQNVHHGSSYHLRPHYALRMQDFKIVLRIFGPSV